VTRDDGRIRAAGAPREGCGCVQTRAPRERYVSVAFSLTAEQALSMRGDASRTYYSANHRASEVPGILAWCHAHGIAEAYLDDSDTPTSTAPGLECGELATGDAPAPRRAPMRSQEETPRRRSRMARGAQ
jgi:hypothetical protein